MAKTGQRFQFVVLHHTGIPEPHFDLLIDWQEPETDKLWAWRIFRSPQEWENGDLSAVRIQDHRPLYMTYEGEISHGRGEVKRVMQGSGNVLSLTHERVIVDLIGDNTTWKIELPSTGPGDYDSARR